MISLVIINYSYAFVYWKVIFIVFCSFFFCIWWTLLVCSNYLNIDHCCQVAKCSNQNLQDWYEPILSIKLFSFWSWATRFIIRNNYQNYCLDKCMVFNSYEAYFLFSRLCFSFHHHQKFFIDLFQLIIMCLHLFIPKLILPPN